MVLLRQAKVLKGDRVRMPCVNEFTIAKDQVVKSATSQNAAFAHRHTGNPAGRWAQRGCGVQSAEYGVRGTEYGQPWHQGNGVPIRAAGDRPRK